MPQSLTDWWKRWQTPARRGFYPFQFAPYEDVERVVAQVIPVFGEDREAFTRGFSAAAAPYEHRAKEAEAHNDRDGARKNYLHAYGLYRMARFPCMHSPEKQAAYVKSQRCLLKAFSFDEAPIEQVDIPFRGRQGEGDKVIGLLRVPPGKTRHPVLIGWAGIDTFKEDWLPRTIPFFERGIATLTIDMPGTGDAPLLGSEDAERMWDAVFEWIGARPEFDSQRVAAWGGSFGGYWATKLAHTHRERLAAVISQGGGAHHVFSREAIIKAQDAGLPWGQAETRGHAFGQPTFEQWLEYAPRLSLLDQGILDRPCAALLCINGVRDPLTPIEDYYLILQHGDPKSARFFSGGHMGASPEGSQEHTVPIMVQWLCSELGL